MRVYTYSEARQRLASLLDEASRGGEVQIRRRDGRLFLIQSVRPRRSPLDVPGMSTGITTEELVRIIREERRGRYQVITTRQRLKSAKTRQRPRALRHPQPR